MAICRRGARARGGAPGRTAAELLRFPRAAAISWQRGRQPGMHRGGKMRMCEIRYAMAMLLTVSSLVVVAAAPADARMRCDGNYQIINGQPHATPYCQDENLA